jgi:pimeloyl-ACP methyl ester carboxylesterase
MGKDLTLKSVQIKNGETLGYIEAGTGDKVIVLVHGNMSSSKHWDVIIEVLSNDYKIYAVDLRGFGISSYNNPIDSIKDFSEDLKLFVDELGIKDFFLAGWSTGGGVSMQFVSNYPNLVKKLILVESVGVKGYPIYPMDASGAILSDKPYQSKEELAKDTVSIIPILEAYKNRDKNFLKALWDAVIYTNNKPSESKYDEYLDDMLTQVNILDVYWALSKFNITNVNNGLTEGTGEVDNITLPTLIIQGERDFVIPPAIGKEIADTIGDNATLLSLDAGHSPFIDCLDVLAQNIVSFIEK